MLMRFAYTYTYAVLVLYSIESTCMASKAENGLPFVSSNLVHLVFGAGIREGDLGWYQVEISAHGNW